MVKFVVITGPIRTGKTTFLYHHFGCRKDVSGFLTPDKDGIRLIFDIQHQRWIDFEAKYPTTDDHIIEVGKFSFYQNGFDYCSELMQNFLLDPSEIFIIDEIGKLEMHDNGLEPSLSKFFAKVTNLNINSTIIMVVRDSILDSFLQKYTLQNVKVLGREDLQDLF